MLCAQAAAPNSSSSPGGAADNGFGSQIGGSSRQASPASPMSAEHAEPRQQAVSAMASPVLLPSARRQPAQAETPTLGTGAYAYMLHADPAA